MKYEFSALAYRSGDINLTEWISLFTLCLSPLIAHIVAGAPEPSILTPDRPQRPRWHDYLVLLNPTTILWRYWAICDAAIRTPRDHWDAVAIAATNAQFWIYPRGWVGSSALPMPSSKGINTEAAVLCLRLPGPTLTRLWSVESVKTLIVFAQGVQVVYTLITGLVQTSQSFASTVAIDSVFQPLAFIGLLRLTAAVWLTNEFYFRANPSFALVEGGEGIAMQSHPGDRHVVEEGGSETRLVESSLDGTRTVSTRLSWRRWWGSFLFRVFYLLPVLFLLAVTILYELPVDLTGEGDDIHHIQATAMAMFVFYLFFLTVSLGIYMFYFFIRPRKSRTTMIPCVGSPWYKAYTWMLIAMTVVLIIVAAIETWKVPCGRFTTRPPSLNPQRKLCPDFKPVAPWYNASRTVYGLANRTADGNETWTMLNFTGSCTGEFGPGSELLGGQ